MLKLTGIRGQCVYVLASAISVMDASESDGTTDLLVDGCICKVSETPEQILALPEMMESMYPAMVVPKGFTWDEYNSVVADLKTR